MFFEDEKIPETYHTIIEKFDSKNYDIIVYNDLNMDNFFADYPFKILENLKEENNEDIEQAILVTNIKDILLFSYRFFHDVFKDFYLILKKENNYQFSGNKLFYPYKVIAKLENLKEEPFFYRKKLIKVIYENKKDFAELVLQSKYDIFEDFDGQISSDEGDFKADYISPYKKYYTFKGRKIFLENTKINADKNILLREGYTSYDFSWYKLSKEELKRLIYFIKKYGLIDDIPYRDVFHNAILINKLSTEEIDQTFDHEIIDIFESNYNEDSNEQTPNLMYIYSLRDDKENIKKMLDLAIKSNLPPKENKAIYWYIQSKSFSMFKEKDDEFDKNIYNLYKMLYCGYKEMLNSELKKLKKITFSKNNILIITTQFMSTNHAPTRRATDYILNFINELDYNVFLVNLNEGYTNHEKIFFYEGIYLDYREDFENIKKLQLNEDVVINFSQLSGNYEIEEIGEVINRIIDFKPKYAITVGGSGNIFSDLIAEYLPVATITCGYTFPRIVKGYPIIPRQIQQEDYEICEFLGIDPEIMIKSELTFKKPAGSGKVLKKDDSKFTIVIVSNRLKNELNIEEVGILDNILEIDGRIQIVIYGSFELYEGNFDDHITSISKYPKKYIFKGHTDDILFSYTGCDIVYNLRRNGGGSSISQAMLMGLPAVSPKYGDGSYVIGRDKCFETSKEIIEEVKKLFFDKKYYKESRNYSLKRAEEIYNTKDMIVKLDKDFSEKIERYGLGR